MTPGGAFQLESAQHRSSVTFTATGQQSAESAAAPNAPDTSTPCAGDDHRVAGSITHSINVWT